MLYNQNCAMCHGEGGDEDGGSMGIPLVGLSSYMSGAEQFEVVNGKLYLQANGVAALLWSAP